VAALLAESLETTTHDLRSFIAIWAALEAFVASAFEVYRVGNNSHLADKFETIAATLDSNLVQEDVARFRAIMRWRNRLFHEGVGQPPYPINDTQQLLQKYLTMHLDHH